MTRLTGLMIAGGLTLCVAGCPGSDAIEGDSGVVEGSGGSSGSGGVVVGSGGKIVGGSGGTIVGGSGGKIVGGSGGCTCSGGAPGSGGKLGSGGLSGSGGKLGSGGAPGSGGKPGSGGAQGVVFPAKFAGNITTRNAVRSDFKQYWNQITPENEGKWGSVQPSQGVFNWGALDAIYKYANDNNIVFKEHTFVWGPQQPDWVNNGNAQTAVRDWMKAFCTRYPKTALIDVVNEPPPHTTPVYKDGMGGAGTSGYDWIANAFKWAREFCPNAVLILNDYNTIEYGGDNTNIINIVNKIKSVGAPIDAVGCQAHAAFGINTATVKSYIDKIVSQTGLPVYITEYDINLQDDTKQKNVMAEQFTMFWTHPSVKGVTLWGYITGSTWLDYTGLMSGSGTFRPAMTWLMGYLGR